MTRDDVDERSPWFQLGARMAELVTHSENVQAVNGGPWLVYAYVNGRKRQRVCQTWAGARLALGLLNRRREAGEDVQLITYSLVPR